MATSHVTTVELVRVDEPLNATERGGDRRVPRRVHRQHADQLHD